jgi:hypothetical protein
MADFPINSSKAIAMDLNAGVKDPSLLKTALKTFKMRSADREVAVDQARMSSIVAAIDGAIQGMAAERTGLIARVRAIVAQPQTVSKQKFWPWKTQSDLSAEEFLRAEQRLNVLARQISDLEFLRASVLEGFTSETR